MSERVEHVFGETGTKKRLEASRRLVDDLFTFLFCDVAQREAFAKRKNQSAPTSTEPWSDLTWPEQLFNDLLYAVLLDDYRGLWRWARYGQKMVYVYSEVFENRAEKAKQLGLSASEYATSICITEYIECFSRKIELKKGQAGGKSTAHVLLERLVPFVGDDPDLAAARLSWMTAEPTPIDDRHGPILKRMRDVFDAARAKAAGYPMDGAPFFGLFLSIGDVRLPVPEEMSLCDVLNGVPGPLTGRFGLEIRQAFALIRKRATELAEGKPVTGQIWDAAEGELRRNAGLPDAYGVYLALRSLFDSAEEPYRRKSIALGVPFRIGKDLSYPETRKAFRLIRCANEFIEVSAKLTALCQRARAIREACRQTRTNQDLCRTRCLYKRKEETLCSLLGDVPGDDPESVERAFWLAWHEDPKSYTIKKFRYRNGSENILLSWDVFRNSSFAADRIDNNYITDPAPLSMEHAYRLAWMLVGRTVEMKGNTTLGSLKIFTGSPVGTWKIYRLGKWGADDRRPERFGIGADAGPDDDDGDRALDSDEESDAGAEEPDPVSLLAFEPEELDSMSEAERAALVVLAKKWMRRRRKSAKAGEKVGFGAETDGNSSLDEETAIDLSWRNLPRDCVDKTVMKAVFPLLEKSYPYDLVVASLDKDRAWKLFGYYLVQRLTINCPNGRIAMHTAERRACEIRNSLPRPFTPAGLMRAFVTDQSLSEALDGWVMGGAFVYRDLGQAAQEARIKVFMHFFRRDVARR